MFPVISVVGWHNVGKTTLVEELVRRLKALGYHVATIKHAHLAPSLDQPGTDTYRYAQAGSDTIGLVAHDMTTLQTRTDDAMDLALLLERVPSGTDIVIVEGYKGSTLPKLEVCEAERLEPIALVPELLVAVKRGGDIGQDAENVMLLLKERGFISV